jgi:dihydroxyacid dehydratase/phosphogluconate dehydratase
MASECGIEFDLFDVAEIFKSTPYIADLKPGGKYVAKDMHEAGGVYMVMKTLLAAGLLDPEPITVTGRTLGENIEADHLEPRPEGDLRREGADHPDRRRGRPARLARARRGDRQGRRA